MAPNNLILVSFVEFTKITAPTPDTDHQVPVLFGMGLGSFKGLDIESVDLKLLATRRGK